MLRGGSKEVTPGTHHTSRRSLQACTTSKTPTQGPFGGGPSGAAYAFSDEKFSRHGPIRAITVRSGAWIDNVQVTYGDTTAPKRGGDGGGTVDTLSLKSGDYITNLRLRTGLYVDGFSIKTAMGGATRKVLGVNGTNWVSATPCSATAVRLVYISGIAKDYLEQITFYWAVAKAQPPPSPPQRPSPCSSPSQTQGPFGGGFSGAAYAFDDAALAGSGTAPITAITVVSGLWIDSLQVTYGSSQAPRHGGAGGSAARTWTLMAGEYITSVGVRSGWYVDGLLVSTSLGRQTVLGVNGTEWTPATPCLGYQARLVYISGIAKDYLEQITFHWAALPASPPPLPPSPPPRPPRPPGPAATIPAQVVMGPFGGGGGRFTPFVDAPPAATARLTGIRVYSGSWTDAIQVAFNGVWGPRRGGGGGGMQELILTSGEFITGAIVRAGAYIDGVTFTTSNNRTLSLGGGGGSPNQAAPCPVGAYKLAQVRGLAGSADEPYLIQLSLVWELLPSGAATALAAEDEARRAGWQCIYGLGSLIRIKSSVPECLSVAGSNTCLMGDCRRMLGCAAVGSGPALQLPGQQLPGQAFGRVACAGADSPSTSKDYQDPTQWCPRAQGLLAMNLPRPVNIRVITLILDVCDTGPSNPVSDIEFSYYNDPHSLQAYWSTISGGQAVFNRETSLIKNVKLPCDKFSRSTCDFENWVSYIDANAAALGVPELSAYPWHRTYIVPALTSCTAVGFSSGNTVYIAGAFASSTTAPNDYLNVFKHELGHNIGLSHSGRGDNAYGDGSDPMGYCQRCLYNAPHMMQLGWSKPYATLSGTQLPPGVPSDPITIAALTARRNTPVVIYPDWLPSSADAAYLGSAIVLSYRMRVGQDIGLPDEFDGAVSVHRAPAVMGMGGDPYVEAVVAKGGRAVVAGARLVVSVAPPTQATLSVAVVRVCRYAVSQAECVIA